MNTYPTWQIIIGWPRSQACHWPRPAGLVKAGSRPSYPPSRIPVESPSSLLSLPRRNLPLRSSFKFAIAPISSAWSPPCRGLSFRVASFSRLRHVNFKFVIVSCSESLHSRVFLPVGSPSGRLATARSKSAGPGRARSGRRARLPSYWQLTPPHGPPVAPAVSVFNRGDGSLWLPVTVTQKVKGY